MNEAPVREVAALVNANGVRVSEFAIDPNSDGAWHHHSQVQEHCYCLKGRIVIEFVGKPTVNLAAGERCEIPAGVAHRLRNPENQICGYLVIQGIGSYDFVESTSDA